MKDKVQKLLEEIDTVNRGDIRREFERKVEEIINTKFEPVRMELWNLIKSFKEENPGFTTYDLPQANRAIDGLALAAGSFINMLDGIHQDKGTAKKIRKALGYNS